MKAAEDGLPSTTDSTTAVGGWDSSEAPVDGTAAASAPTDAWAANEPGKDALGSLETEQAKPASSAAPTVKASGWAGLFAKPTPPPAPKKAPEPTQAPPVPGSFPEETTPAPAAEETNPVDAPPSPPPIEATPIDDTPGDLPSTPHSDTAADIPPSKDVLNESNLEKLPDTSQPQASATAASTVASTQDPLAATDKLATPAVRPGMSGYAASALKATSGVGRSASYMRRVQEQQEAVVMPGNHAVDRAAVQFGKMGLGDTADDIDVDEDREEPETRTQLPDDSPVAPRASLPPSMPESQASTAPDAQAEPVAEAPQTRQAPGLPPVPQHAQQQSSPKMDAGYPDQYRYGGQAQKPYDPFGQQPQQHQSQGQGQSQEPFATQVPSQSQPLSGSTQHDYSAYYNSRDAYQNYYGGYGQGQDAQRVGSTAGTSAQDNPSQYATARPGHGYGQPDTQDSGNNTPNPTMATHQTVTQPSQQQHLPPSQGGQGGYPYGYSGAYGQQYPQYGNNYMNNMNHTGRYGSNRPMFDDVRRQGQDDYSYGNQYGYGHNQQYGASNYKSNMYGQPHAYSQHDYSSSPANAAAGFGGREAMYGRTGSTQPLESQQPAGGSSGYAGMQEPFGRASSAFGGSQGITQQHSGYQGGEDPSKAAGPSPSMQGGRPGSTVNTAQAQSGLPPPQSQHSGQQAFGGYPQYGGVGGFGQQSSQQHGTGYGAYGSNNAAFGSYGGYGGGRGWNGNYGGGH